jgi:hypothetical protein
MSHLNHLPMLPNVPPFEIAQFYSLRTSKYAYRPICKSLKFLEMILDGLLVSVREQNESFEPR